MSASERPLPVPDLYTAPYWTGAALGELRIIRCHSCQFYIHPPRPACPRCMSEDVGATAVSGNGSVYSFSVMHNPGNPGFDHQLPYAVVVVELDEQPGLFTIANIGNVTPAQISIGMPVRVVFERVDGVVLPQFEAVL